MDKKITEVKSAFLFFPPEEVFENPYAVFADYQGLQTLKLKKWSIILGEDGGMFFDDGEHLPYPGVICPVIVQRVATIKRILISRLKNPFILLWHKKFKQEIVEIAYVELRRYYLKPNRYCRAVRELYRLLDLIIPKEYDIIHTI